MRLAKPQPTPTALEEVIDDAINLLNDYTAADPEYATIVDQIVKLEPLKPTKHSWRPSPDALLAAAANTLAIIVVTKHERFEVITSKAWSTFVKAVR